MNKLNKAIILASKIHSGKKGKNKESAILHPIRVMQKMNTNKTKIIAILHDVIETGKISIIDLEEMGFNKKICEAIDALSRKKWEKYDNYILRVKKNKTAVKVKLEDLIDNHSKRRSYKKKSKTDFKKMKKYEKAYKTLSGSKIPLKV